MLLRSISNDTPFHDVGDAIYVTKLKDKGVVDPQPARNEKWVKQQVKQYLFYSKCYYTMPFTGGYGNSGVSDFLVCFQGVFIGIECKSGDHIPTALQEKNLKAIQEAGGYSIMVNDQTIRYLPLYFLFIGLNYHLTKRKD
jgi:hypothetical protein